MKNIVKYLSFIAVISTICSPTISAPGAMTFGYDGTGSSSAYHAQGTAGVTATLPMEMVVNSQLQICVPDETENWSDCHVTIDEMMSAHDHTTVREAQVSRTGESLDYPGTSENELLFIGALFSNTSSIFEVEQTDYIHTENSNMILKNWTDLSLQDASDSTMLIDLTDDSNSATSIFDGGPITRNITNDLNQDNNGVLYFKINSRVYLDSIDLSDRTGAYISHVLVSVSSL